MDYFANRYNVVYVMHTKKANCTQVLYVRMSSNVTKRLPSIISKNLNACRTGTVKGCDKLVTLMYR